jgi:hypothetical protein
MDQLSHIHLSIQFVFQALRQGEPPSVSIEGVVITLIVVLILLVGAGVGARWLYGDKP